MVFVWTIPKSRTAQSPCTQSRVHRSSLDSCFVCDWSVLRPKPKRDASHLYEQLPVCVTRPLVKLSPVMWAARFECIYFILFTRPNTFISLWWGKANVTKTHLLVVQLRNNQHHLIFWDGAFTRFTEKPEALLSHLHSPSAWCNASC